MDFNKAIGSRYFTERAENGSVMVGSGMGGERGLGGVLRGVST